MNRRGPCLWPPRFVGSVLVPFISVHRRPNAGQPTVAPQVSASLLNHGPCRDPSESVLGQPFTSSNLVPSALRPTRRKFRNARRRSEGDREVALAESGTGHTQAACRSPGRSKANYGRAQLLTEGDGGQPGGGKDLAHGPLNNSPAPATPAATTAIQSVGWYSDTAVRARPVGNKRVPVARRRDWTNRPSAICATTEAAKATKATRPATKYELIPSCPRPPDQSGTPLRPRTRENLGLRGLTRPGRPADHHGRFVPQQRLLPALRCGPVRDS